MAILLSNFLSSVVILNPSQYQGSGNWLTGEKVLICTSEGLKWISVDSLHQQNSALSQQHASQGEHGDIKFHCPILKHHQATGTFLTGVLFFLLAVLSLHQKFRLNNRKSFSQRIYFSYAPKHSPPSFGSLN
ncbi:hypothetical protein [Photobacterium alginatilyticum]|uniref:hypothetical protein n=1 Tax=Photobacterium alginatilyticum TaxID=1775171 RepID=UPI00136875CE|nr:hypothetical protein [Photobacterium alginatilyticum]